MYTENTASDASYPAVFSVYNCYDEDSGKFITEGLWDYIVLGSAVSVKMGYGDNLEEVFRGYVSTVDFCCGSKGEIPHIEVLCMDIKGVMMTGNHECQLMSDNYGDAIREIFQKSVYSKLSSKGVYANLQIDNTPDKERGKSEGDDITIEMLGESDYEFAVRAAKKFNFDFFTDCGTVIFRKAKTKAGTLVSMDMFRGIKEFDIQYDLSGIVETIQVRGTNYGKSELIMAKSKSENKISRGNRARQIIQGSEKIYIDTSLRSEMDAGCRLRAVEEENQYSFCLVKCKCVGLPEIKPGNFFEIEGMGIPSSKFYITQVIHRVDDEVGFVTEITARAKSID